MKAANIQPNDSLILKPAKAAAYGMPKGSIVKVDSIQARKGYEVPWIVSVNERGERDYYKPQDFERKSAFSL